MTHTQNVNTGENVGQTMQIYALCIKPKTQKERPIWWNSSLFYSSYTRFIVLLRLQNTHIIL